MPAAHILIMGLHDQPPLSLEFASAPNLWTNEPHEKASPLEVGIVCRLNSKIAAEAFQEAASPKLFKEADLMLETSWLFGEVSKKTCVRLSWRCKHLPDVHDFALLDS